MQIRIVTGLAAFAILTLMGCATTPGPQAHLFHDELYTADYTASEDSNRMGIRLKGPALTARRGVLAHRRREAACVQDGERGANQQE